MKKNIFRILLSCIAAIILAFTFVGCANDDGGKKEDQPPAEKTVTSIVVETMPEKTEYVVGEEFTLEGGTIKVTYSDNSTQTVSMTAQGVSFVAPNMNTAAKKNITISYGGKSVVFQVNVVTAQYSFTYNYNYQGAENKVVKISRGSKAEAETPSRDGFAFYKWYSNPDYTTEYSFDTPVMGDTTIYALWKENGKQYVDVTFKYDFYGNKLSEYTYPVQVGSPVAEPVADPVRYGYKFDKWVTVSGGTEEFDFTKPVTEAVTIYATWTKTLQGVQNYVFEAEDTDLTGKIGPGASGTAQETGMIVYDESLGASGNRFVSYLYDNNLSLEFYIASDSDVNDVKLSLSLSVEIGSFVFNNGNYKVLVNDQEISYPQIEISLVNGKDAPKFADFTISTSVSLKKGQNLIRLVTSNTQTTPGSTYKAIAPMVDCTKLSTEAVLTWDGNKGLPMPNYTK